jgi:hypothetical protein
MLYAIGATVARVLWKLGLFFITFMKTEHPQSKKSQKSKNSICLPDNIMDVIVCHLYCPIALSKLTQVSNGLRSSVSELRDMRFSLGKQIAADLFGAKLYDNGQSWNKDFTVEHRKIRIAVKASLEDDYRSDLLGCIYFSVCITCNENHSYRCYQKIIRENTVIGLTLYFNLKYDDDEPHKRIPGYVYDDGQYMSSTDDYGSAKENVEFMFQCIQNCFESKDKHPNPL